MSDLNLTATQLELGTNYSNYSQYKDSVSMQNRLDTTTFGGLWQQTSKAYSRTAKS